MKWLSMKFPTRFDSAGLRPALAAALFLLASPCVTAPAVGAEEGAPDKAAAAIYQKRAGDVLGKVAAARGSLGTKARAEVDDLLAIAGKKAGDGQFKEADFVLDEVLKVVKEAPASKAEPDPSIASTGKPEKVTTSEPATDASPIAHEASGSKVKKVLSKSNNLSLDLKSDLAFDSSSLAGSGASTLETPQIASNGAAKRRERTAKKDEKAREKANRKSRDAVRSENAAPAELPPPETTSGADGPDPLAGMEFRLSDAFAPEKVRPTGEPVAIEAPRDSKGRRRRREKDENLDDLVKTTKIAPAPAIPAAPGKEPDGVFKAERLSPDEAKLYKKLLIALPRAELEFKKHPKVDQADRLKSYRRLFYALKKKGMGFEVTDEASEGLTQGGATPNPLASASTEDNATSEMAAPAVETPKPARKKKPTAPKKKPKSKDAPKKQA